MGNRDREEEAGKGSRGDSQANKVGVPSSEQDAGHARGGDNTSILSFPLCTIIPNRIIHLNISHKPKISVDHVDSITKNQLYH